MKSRDLAKAKISWKLGNGEDIQFWSNSWLIQVPLMNDLIYDVWVKHYIQLFGLKVYNYRNDQGWIDLSIIFDDLKPIMLMLNSMALSNKRDEMIWGDNSNANYSVASGYMDLWSLKEKPPWSRAWIPSLTPKINIFY